MEARLRSSEPLTDDDIQAMEAALLSVAGDMRELLNGSEQWQPARLRVSLPGNYELFETGSRPVSSYQKNLLVALEHVDGRQFDPLKHQIGSVEDLQRVLCECLQYWKTQPKKATDHPESIQ